MSRIIIADSLSRNCDLALQVGLDWAAKLSSEPFVLHADKLADYETLDSVFAHLNLEVHQNYVQSILDANTNAISEQFKRLDIDGTDIKSESRSGDPSDILLQEVNTDNVELVVLGHNTHKGLANLFLGGVTESILHKSKHSILITKNDKADAPKKIMIAYDFSFHCDEAVNWALKLANSFNAEIHLVNILPCYYQGHHIAHSLQNGFNDAMEEMINESVKSVEAKLQSKVEELKSHGATVIGKIVLDKEGSVPDKLNEYVDENDIDLISMGSHAKGKIAELFLGSIANKMIKKSNVSILLAK